MNHKSAPSPHRHLDRSQLLQVLDDDSFDMSPDDLSLVHIEACPRCREHLESLAAEPHFWNHAATLLDDERLGDTVSLGTGHWSSVGDSGSLKFDDPSNSIRQLFDAPAHPEMLGRLGGYDIEREIGRGGMGVVLKAFDSELNRPVAIKIMSPLLAGRGACRERFAREARAAAAILHPNVIAIHGISVTERIPWLVMPYITGPSLEQMVEERGPLPEKDIVRTSLQISSGLAAAHAQGVIHRDIKPANILVENGVGRVIITDFGLARAESEVSMTQTGWFAGTPAFMSPEQASGHDIDHRSDLFSLGSVMYYMATGRYPFRAEQPMAILERIRAVDATPAQVVNSDISRALSRLIERLLVKNPADRIQSAAELQQILEQYLAHLQHPTRVRQPRIAAPRRSRLPWRRVVTMAGIILASASAGIGLMTLSPINKPTFAPDNAPRALTVREQYETVRQRHGLTSAEEFAQRLSQVEMATRGFDAAFRPGPLPSFGGQDPIVGELRELELAIQELEQRLTE